MLSIIIAYYNQPAALKWQLSLWRQWPMIALFNSEIILVDDGSMNAPALAELAGQSLPTGFRLYRVTKDIPWNQSGARNLGASVAVGEWLLFLDIDHGLSPLAAADMVELSATPTEAKWFTFPRRYRGKHLHAAPNIFMMPKQTFTNLGGYDEDLTGEYVQDRLFIAQARRTIGAPERMDTIEIDVIDEPTPALNRASPRNIDLIQRKLSGDLPMSRDMLRFPWERLI